MARLGHLDQRQADAVEARTELDLRIGAAFTRFQTLALQTRFTQLDGHIISYGSHAGANADEPASRRWRARRRRSSHPMQRGAGR